MERASLEGSRMRRGDMRAWACVMRAFVRLCIRAVGVIAVASGQWPPLRPSSVLQNVGRRHSLRQISGSRGSGYCSCDSGGTHAAWCGAGSHIPHLHLPAALRDVWARSGMMACWAGWIGWLGADLRCRTLALPAPPAAGEVWWGVAVMAVIAVVGWWWCSGGWCSGGWCGDGGGGCGEAVSVRWRAR
ncbi:hypothetical protein DFH27DRAFT_543897 [Peziza echinospora]|nr:hypothetical protein DFH27DRAFT_543897 [Peziza echinospora]